MHADTRVRASALTLLLLAACGGGEQGDEQPGDGRAERPAEERFPDDPPGARRATLEELRASRAAERHPADGGGRAWLELAEGERAAVRASGHGTWTIVYEAGPEGVAVGGKVRLIVSPFWGWSGPQVRVPHAPGYCEVTCEAEGVELAVDAPQWLEVEVRGRALRAGERLRIVYGAGPAQARADTYAERGARLWIAVDGDGDGVHGVLRDSPGIDVEPGPPGRLHLVLPSTARPGTEVPLVVAVLDAAGNAGIPFEGEVELAAVPETIELPSVSIAAGDGGVARVTVVPREEGVHRLVARIVVGGEGGREVLGESNPLSVQASTPRVLWGDLHGHSQLSDGTGTPEDYLRYARDVAGLDVVSLTDHDHWGMLFLDEDPELWDHIKRETARFHDPGTFVTLLGYEWTNWVHGHRHVLYFADDGPLLSSVDPEWETPDQLWEGLRGLPALTFAHHSAGGPVPTNWDYAPDPVLEPVTEVASVHGSSEAMDAPQRIYSPVEGNFVRDVLERGHRLGFVGSGDGHDGHPGLAHVAGGKGGLAAILSEDLTRAGVLSALRGRRVYATNGPRILLRCALGGHRMGAAIPAAELAGPALLYVHAIACAPLERIDVIRRGAEVQTISAEEAWDFTTAVELEDLAPGDFVYVRAVQIDGGTAWSSPFYVE